MFIYSYAYVDCIDLSTYITFEYYQHLTHGNLLPAALSTAFVRLDICIRTPRGTRGGRFYDFLTNFILFEEILFLFVPRFYVSLIDFTLEKFP